MQSAPTKLGWGNLTESPIAQYTPGSTDKNSSEITFKEFPVPGLRYYSNFITEKEQAAFLKQIDSLPWSNRLSRRTQQYGFDYDYGARNSEDELRLTKSKPFPKWLSQLAVQLNDKNILPHVPDQAIINEYRPGQGINPHKDHEGSFKDWIASLTLGSGVTMDFTNYKTKQTISVYLEPRSLVVLSGDARYNWSHGIDPKLDDIVNGVKVPRNRRVSVTFRKVQEIV
eukprot:TRINITY_DN10685_c0_g1_i1.p1 TRINITY_DN10685_c0_g1~~TRINITY_DN10685_c0_g1_i1.p1  ORF type:complete len:227 (-),score=42.93 TRINITY_DN10685_c0_g1_i1:105-785(-)